LRNRKKNRFLIKQKKKTKKKKNGILPILGVHSKFNLKIMEEIKPPFDKKTQKKLRNQR